MLKVFVVAMDTSWAKEENWFRWNAVVDLVINQRSVSVDNLSTKGAV